MVYQAKPQPPTTDGVDLGDAVITTKLDAVINWGRRNSLWPFPFGTACCAIEFMGTVSSVFDISRFGAELVRFSPRQADLLIIAGTVTYKQAPVLRQIYDQMCDPKWVISAGACASTGGFMIVTAPFRVWMKSFRSTFTLPVAHHAQKRSWKPSCSCRKKLIKKAVKPGRCWPND